MDPNNPMMAAPDLGAAPEPEGDEGGSMEMCVPLSSLGQPDEQDNMQPPAVGDPVTFTTEGTISRVEGDNAYITPTAVNGQKIENSAPAMPEEDRLRQMASAMPPGAMNQ
jgi:hypothetical protein